MNKNVISEKLIEINPWWENPKFRFDGLIERDIYVNQVYNRSKTGKLIEVLIGARRVGKTSIFNNLINLYLNKKIKRKNVIYLTSETRLFRDFNLDEIIETFVNRDEEYFIFIDEVQDIDDWQRVVKYYYDNFNVHFFLTGSSSLILKPQTSKLTGRFVLTEVLPLNLKEFLHFKKFRTPKSSTKKVKIVQEYLKTGGYPEYVLKGEEKYLISAYESTLFRDLLSEYNIRNPRILKDMVDYLSDKITNTVSPLTLSKNLGISHTTIRFYLDYLAEVYLIYPVFANGRSHKITKSSLPKYYLNDTGLLHSRSLNSKVGFLAENAVYLKLRSELESPEYAGIFYEEVNGQEVDFITLRPNLLYEVKYRTNVDDNDLAKYNDIDNLTVILRDDIRVSKGYNFNTIGLFDFLMR